MPGMYSGRSDQILVTAFRAALLQQGVFALFIFALLATAWVGAREWVRVSHAAVQAARPAPEPAWRWLLRTGFGVLWIFDGMLQAQPAMVTGLPSRVIEPAAAGSPDWVQQLASWAGTTWSHHPVQASTSVVWIQLGIGIWLLAAPRGPWSRVAGLVSVGWGLAVWAGGEAFGGIFAPGLTWLFGAPGAAALYCVAGLLVALPESSWRTRRLGRAVLGAAGLFFLGMAVVQAWPGRGFWQGTRHGGPGTLTAMVRSMADTPQPRLTGTWVSRFGSFTATHGFVVNLVAVAALAAIGATLVTGRPRLTRVAVIALAAVCLADWVLIQDLGFFGGLGTDPGSMIPMALLVMAGYLALTRPAATPAPGLPGTSWRDQIRPGSLARRTGAAGTGAVVAAWAVALVVLGAAPMVLAQASPSAVAGWVG